MPDVSFPMDRSCPKCGAPAGHPCAPFSRSAAPPPMKGFHVERRGGCDPLARATFSGRRSIALPGERSWSVWVVQVDHPNGPWDAIFCNTEDQARAIASMQKRFDEALLVISQQAERAALAEMELGRVRKLLRAMAVLHGAVHESECPADDTCQCRRKGFNDRVNAACREVME